MKSFGIVFSIILCALLVPVNTSAQQTERPKLSIGIEQDMLPYILKGFIITGWMGRDQFRQRFSYAEAVSPKKLNDAGVESDRVEAFGLSFEYFFRDEFRGWWLGPGFGYWTNRITAENGTRIKNESLVFSLGGGYNIPLWKGFYTTPWIATHFRVSGRDAITAGNAVYSPNLFTPELSWKIGYRFGL